MNIFVAGIHGVGKTYLASRLPAAMGLLHTSASKLIKEELALPEWNPDKRVTDVMQNQVALVKAVARHNSKGTALLLDGHFVLLNTDGEFVQLSAEVFKTLNLSAVLLVEADPKVVSVRVQGRDNLRRDSDWLATFMCNEREHTKAACSELNVPLRILMSPSEAEFASAVASLL
ncbi:MAG: ATP-binding protein [Polaromonas sp.]|uniref:ATP-binding protein n=1 Tax=Polaromonas sp. TaxID=1869339 RepID=UPI003264F6FA